MHQFKEKFKCKKNEGELNNGKRFWTSRASVITGSAEDNHGAQRSGPLLSGKEKWGSSDRSPTCSPSSVCEHIPAIGCHQYITSSILESIWHYSRTALAFVYICYCNIKNILQTFLIHFTCIRSQRYAEQSGFQIRKLFSFSMFCIKKLVGQMSRMKLTKMHFLTFGAAGTAWQGTWSSINAGLYAIPAAWSCLKAHTFKSPCKHHFRWLDSRLIKLWKRPFIPLSWNGFSFTSSLGGAGGGAGGFGLNFGFSIIFSGSGSGS